MITVRIMIKRKRGTSRGDFINYYKTTYAPLGASKVPNMKHCLRHRIRSYGNGVYGADAKPPYDVLTQRWFDGEADFKRGVDYRSDRETAAIIGADREKQVERSSIRCMRLEDHETDMRKL